MRTLENILDLDNFTLMSEGKKVSRSSCPWWDNCISQVKLQVVTDKTTSRDNLRQKIKDYASNYIAYQPEASYIQRNAYLDDIADEVEKELEDFDFEQENLANIVAQKEREKIPKEPENRFIRLGGHR